MKWSGYGTAGGCFRSGWSERGAYPKVLNNLRLQRATAEPTKFPLDHRVISEKEGVVTGDNGVVRHTLANPLSVPNRRISRRSKPSTARFHNLRYQRLNSPADRFPIVFNFDENGVVRFVQT
jgi:hypothetical protein